MAPKVAAPQPIKTEPDAKDREAMSLIANWARPGTEKSFPSKLKTYLKENRFLVEISPSFTAHVLPFEVRFNNEQVKVVALATGTSIQGDPLKFDAHVVRMIPRLANGQAISIFEPGNFITIDLSAPNPTPRVVATVQLQGCSFVIGFDKNNKNVVHLGHAQPAGAHVPTPSVVLADHYKKAPLDQVFQGQQLKKVKVIGGYGSDEQVKLLGWISAAKLFLAIKTSKDLTIKEYPKSKLFG